MRGNKTLAYFSKTIDKIAELTAREKEVVLKRLRSKTLEKIGKKFKLTEARIRQIEKTALMKIESKWHQQRLFPQ
jgi:DNA-directed RNA polymerase sigma subunit (sigma70/sigma32)